jgi:hypothetical protein
VVREGVREGGEMTQTLYAHMNKRKKKEKQFTKRAKIWFQEY